MTVEIKQINKCGNKYKCSSCLKTIGIVGLIGNTILALLKIFVGIAFFSIALLADALYSLLDIGYSVLVIIGIKISSRPPDRGHEYGHGKVEFIIAGIFSVVTVIAAICLFVLALFELHNGVSAIFSGYVLLVAVISILANYLFFKFSECIATQFENPSIRTLSIHSKADAISSLLVGISVGFSYFGYHHAGPFVAIIETAHILIIGSEIFKDSLYGLLDASIPQEDVKNVKSVLTAIHGIKNVNYVKSRKIGQKIWLNIEIELPGSHNISKVDAIKNNINEAIKSKIRNVEDIMINVLPFREEEEKGEMVAVAG